MNHRNFKQCDPTNFNSDMILNMTDDQEIGYEFDVDLEYPKELHDYHNDYPLAPEKIAIQYEQLSEHSNEF